MLFHLKKLARQSLPLLVSYKIYDNWRLKRRFASGKIQTLHGATHSQRSLSESLAYIDEQIGDYLKYSGLSLEQFQGKRILELGFGDNVGASAFWIFVNDLAVGYGEDGNEQDDGQAHGDRP